MYTLVSFSIWSDDLRHEEITAKTNIHPDTFFHKGDIKMSMNKPIVRKFGFWGLSSKLEQTTALDTQINSLLDVLVPHGDYFLELSKTATVRFFCTVDELPSSGEVQPDGLILMPGAGFGLAASTLTRMGSIGAALDVDIMW
jgi:hypothetical protein